MKYLYVLSEWDFNRAPTGRGFRWAYTGFRWAYTGFR